MLELKIQSTLLAALWTSDSGRTMVLVAGGSGPIEVLEPEAGIMEACGVGTQFVPGLALPASDEIALEGD